MNLIKIKYVYINMDTCNEGVKLGITPTYLHKYVSQFLSCIYHWRFLRKQRGNLNRRMLSENTKRNLPSLRLTEPPSRVPVVLSLSLLPLRTPATLEVTFGCPLSLSFYSLPLYIIIIHIYQSLLYVIILPQLFHLNIVLNLPDL